MKLHVKAIPNASRTECAGWESDPAHGRVLRVRVAAPPVEGKANEALRVFLANCIKLPKSKVVLQRGETSRIKVFSIPDGTALPD